MLALLYIRSHSRPLVAVTIALSLILVGAAAVLLERPAGRPADQPTSDRPARPASVAVAATKPAEAATTAGRVYAPLIFGRYTPTACDGIENRAAPAVIDGQPIAWRPLTLRFSGPTAAAGDDAPNPFLDYRLSVRFVSPSGRAYDVPGFFAGDGRGGGTGDQWAARFSADEPGRWRYCASFRAGPDVAVELSPLAGHPAAFDGASGAFDVAPRDPDAPGFLRWGRLEYVGGHYLKFRDGPYRIKGGTNSPENFLGYVGFRNTVDQGGLLPGFLHSYAPHVAHWRAGDPTLPGAPDDGRGIIGALNYLSSRGVNSIYFLPMNLGGDGADTYPFLSPHDTTHYDVGKLEQWNVVFEHAQRRGIALHVVLNETEPENRAWLGDGLSVERRLFYRELVARFGHLLAIKWNLSEEVAFTAEESLALAGYLQAVEWADHPIAVHNQPEQLAIYHSLLGRAEFSATALQYGPNYADPFVEQWRAASAAAGRPWVVELDENNPAAEGLSPFNADLLRRVILYDAYFSGGHIEWYAGYHELPIGGDLNLEDFSTRQEMWDYMRYARRFLEQYTPFWLMSPADGLLTDEAADYGGGEVFALEGEVYAIHLSNASAPDALLSAPDGVYHLRWYDPRTGHWAGGARTVSAEEGLLPIGSPPSMPERDWVILITAAGYTPPLPNAYP